MFCYSESVPEGTAGFLAALGPGKSTPMDAGFPESSEIANHLNFILQGLVPRDVLERI